jgi:hypothetical protein
MKLPSFIHKINWRIITAHVFATFFIILAAKQLSNLYDIEIIKLVDKYGAENAIKQLQKENNFSGRIAYFLFWNGASNLIGLLIGSTISLIIIIKKKIFWINSLIVFIIGLSFIRLGFFKNQIIQTLFYSFGSFFNDSGILYKCVINGIILVLFAVFIFFNKWTNNFALNYSMKVDPKTNQI